MTTGEKLQSLRKQNNYTQEDLADIMSVSRQSISKWESDIAFPETEKLIALAKLYNCSIDYLLNNENDDPICGIIKQKENRVYNKKRLPLILSTLGTYILSLILFIPKWFDFKVDVFEKIPVNANGAYVSHYTGISYRAYLNPYDFFSLTTDHFTNAQAIKPFCIILFVLAVSIMIACLVYSFIDKKPFTIIIRVANTVYFLCLVLLILLSLTLAWTGVQIPVIALSTILVVVQYAVPVIRKTH